MRGGDLGRCSAALLGRFLPRLGPFGPPSGPFYLDWPLFQCVPSAVVAGFSFPHVVLHCNMLTKVKLIARSLFRGGSPLE